MAPQTYLGVVNLFTDQTRIVGNSPPKSHFNFCEKSPAMTKDSSLMKINSIALRKYKSGSRRNL
jgi:hypothetical protein